MIAFLAAIGCGPTPEDQLEQGLALVDRDPTGAVAHLGPACAAGLLDACSAAGALPIDHPDKPTWNERACLGGDASACSRRSETPSDRFRVKACMLGDGPSCALQAGEATGDLRRSLLDQACTLGHLPSCLPAGDAARAAGDKARAADLYRIRCAADPQSTACLLADRTAMADPPGEIPMPTGDPSAVSAALWARCAANEAWACLQLAEHVDRGGPLPAQARGDAAWLRGQACDLQLSYACAPHD